MRLFYLDESGFSPSLPTGSTIGPILQVLDLDNATVREKLKLPERLTGRSLLSSRRDVMYSISDSGVMTDRRGTSVRAARSSANARFVKWSGVGAATPINMQGGMDSTLARKVTNDAAASLVLPDKWRNLNFVV